MLLSYCGLWDEQKVMIAGFWWIQSGIFLKVFLYPRNEVRGGGILDLPCLSVRPFVRPSVCPLTFCVHQVASTVQDGFFSYLAHMITIIGECVRCYVVFRIWKNEFLANFWKFSALTLKKGSTVLEGFFPYLAQMITSMRGCVAYDDLWPWPISSRSFGPCLENHVRSVASTVLDMDSFHIWYKWSLAWEGVSHVMIFDLDLYLQCHLTLTLKIMSPL